MVIGGSSIVMVPMGTVGAKVAVGSLDLPFVALIDVLAAAEVDNVLLLLIAVVVVPIAHQTDPEPSASCKPSAL